MERRLANTALAHWLVHRMSRWIDPNTYMPGLSQHKLARLSGVSQAQVHEILKQGHAPKPETLDRLARFFGVGAVYLYRLAYRPDNLSPEILAKIDRLESILEKLPPGIVENFLDSQVAKAETYLREAEQ